MRIYWAQKKYHKVYDDVDELPDGLVIYPDWRTSSVGDWVKADDGCYIQILRKGKLSRRRGSYKYLYYVGTCTGTFVCQKYTKMDTSRRANIYTFSGKDTPSVLQERANCTANERVFAALIASGEGRIDAYLKSFPTNNRTYANEQSALLLKQERITQAVREELKPVLETLGIDAEFILRYLKEVIMNEGAKDESKLKAAFKLADILDLEDKTKTKETAIGVVQWTGFKPEQLEAISRPPQLEE